MEEDTLFGYERVPATVKTSRVRAVFDSVAERYDVMNDLMSAGAHRLWKRFAIGQLDPRPGEQVLDLASGTADLARLVARRTRGRASVIACDINAQMLARGRDRSLDEGLASGIEYVQASAEALPFAARTIDRVVIGFGLRNVTDKPASLEEMCRVLRPGGRLVVLEFSTMKAPLLARVYDLYSFKVLPAMGRVVAGDADSYRYLAESIRVHPDQDTLSRMLSVAGFERVRCHDLCGGAVAVHTAFKA